MKGVITLELNLTRDNFLSTQVGEVIFKAGDTPADICDAVQRVSAELYSMAEKDIEAIKATGIA